jgi:hypothetical protein
MDVDIGRDTTSVNNLDALAAAVRREHLAAEAIVTEALPHVLARLAYSDCAVKRAAVTPIFGFRRSCARRSRTSLSPTLPRPASQQPKAKNTQRFRPCPTAWKKFHRLRGGDKEGSRRRALQLFPNAHTLLARKTNHGRAEAALIALTGIST